MGLSQLQQQVDELSNILNDRIESLRLEVSGLEARLVDLEKNDAVSELMRKNTELEKRLLSLEVRNMVIGDTHG